jgi:hypothetical protein
MGAGRATLESEPAFGPGGAVPSAAKAVFLVGLDGTTEVVPCYKTIEGRLFPQPVKPFFLIGFNGTPEGVPLQSTTTASLE